MLGSLHVVAKRPAAGQTKTRLCPPLSGENAAALYECFLRDTLDIMRRVENVQRSIVYLPQSEEAYFRQLAPDMTLALQQGKSLGERLDHLLSRALTTGSGKAVVMDSDSPTLPADYVAQAFRQLDDADVVLGPCRDGGYYLIGVKHPQPRILREVEMSTPHVLRDTLALAEEIGLSVALLPEWYDVDTVSELQELRAELATVDTAIAVHTRKHLAQLTW